MFLPLAPQFSPASLLKVTLRLCSMTWQEGITKCFLLYLHAQVPYNSRELLCDRLRIAQVGQETLQTTSATLVSGCLGPHPVKFGISLRMDPSLFGQPLPGYPPAWWKLFSIRNQNSPFPEFPPCPCIISAPPPCAPAPYCLSPLPYAPAPYHLSTPVCPSPVSSQPPAICPSPVRLSSFGWVASVCQLESPA